MRPIPPHRINPDRPILSIGKTVAVWCEGEPFREVVDFRAEVDGFEFSSGHIEDDAVADIDLLSFFIQARALLINEEHLAIRRNDRLRAAADELRSELRYRRGGNIHHRQPLVDAIPSQRIIHFQGIHSSGEK